MRPLRLSLAGVVTMLGLALIGYLSAVADPLIRRQTFALLPAGGASEAVTLALLSDIHVAGPDMPPSRLGRIVRQVNALRPDIIVIAGDFVSDKAMASRVYPAQAAVAPLAGLRPRIGTYAVLGNHDHWRDAAAMRTALAGVGVTVLDNSAVRAGPLAIGGLDDDFTGHARPDLTVRAMRALGGVPVLLSHSPDPFPAMPPDVPLMLAGHTHCGQVSLPLIAALSYASRHGRRYGCGLVREGARTLIVGAGLGTSLIPLRIGAPPDIWLVRLER